MLGWPRWSSTVPCVLLDPPFLLYPLTPLRFGLRHEPFGILMPSLAPLLLPLSLCVLRLCGRPAMSAVIEPLRVTSRTGQGIRTGNRFHHLVVIPSRFGAFQLHATALCGDLLFARLHNLAHERVTGRLFPVQLGLETLHGLQSVPGPSGRA
jgi:hypothetical protein